MSSSLKTFKKIERKKIILEKLEFIKKNLYVGVVGILLISAFSLGPYYIWEEIESIEGFKIKYFILIAIGIYFLVGSIINIAIVNNWKHSDKSFKEKLYMFSKNFIRFFFIIYGIIFLLYLLGSVVGPLIFE